VPRRGLRISARETGPPQGDSEAPDDRLPSRASKRERGGPGKPGPRRRKGEPQRGNATRVRSGGTLACPVGRLPEGSSLRSRERGQRTCAERHGRNAGGDVCGSAGAGPCRWKLRSAAGVKQTRRGSRGDASGRENSLGWETRGEAEARRRRRNAMDGHRRGSGNPRKAHSVAGSGSSCAEGHQNAQEGRLRGGTCAPGASRERHGRRAE